MNPEDFKQHWDAAAIPPNKWRGSLYFTSDTGHKIRYGHAPAQGQTIGSVVLTHGYGEHIDIYFETIKNYQKMGYEVFAMDWHGHGKSEHANKENHKRSSSQGMQRHADDLNSFIEDVVTPQRHPDSKSLIMSTNSMGGHAGLLYLKDHDDVFDAAIMSTPMFDITRMGLPKAITPVLRWAFNAASKIGLKNVPIPTGGSISKKLERFAQPPTDTKQTDLSGLNIRSYIADLVRAFHPKAQIGEPTVGWIASVYNSVHKAMQPDFLKSIKTPVLIGTAGKDDLVDNEALDKAVKYMPNAEQLFLPSATHVLWLEPDENHNRWWDAIDDFLERRTKSPKPGTPDNDDTIPFTQPANNNAAQPRNRSFNGFAAPAAA